MKLLIHGLNFAPELTGIGKYTGEMVGWLARRGHDVRVVTAPPYYPDWRVASGYAGWRYCTESWQFGAAEAAVWRAPLWVPKMPSGAKRLLHLGSFGLSSLPAMLAHLRWRPDVVLAVIPTLFSAPAALLTARLTGAKSWLHIADFEVDAAFEMGILRSERARRWCLNVERALLRRFNRVSTISERMLARLAEKGVPESQRVFFPYWADISGVHPLGYPSSFRAELGLTDDQMVALYAGNLGEKQGLDLLIQAAHTTRSDSRIVWVIAGAGGARSRLEEMASGLRNVRWLPLQPVDKLNDLLNLADIHVLPQRADAADLVMPSKLNGMLASGRPVVATAAAETQVGQVVSDCGACVAPGDAAVFVHEVVALSRDPDRRRELGRRARHYAETHLRFETIMARFEQEAMALVSGAAEPTFSEDRREPATDDRSGVLPTPRPETD